MFDMSKIRGGLIVSCQAEEGTPLDDADIMAAIAEAAAQGGAVAIRANGVKHIEAIRKRVDLPIIGLLKRRHASGRQWITPTLDDAERVVNAGANIVAVDATQRHRDFGTPSDVIIRAIQGELETAVLADIDELEAAAAAVDAGAAAVATTLSGYTPRTQRSEDSDPDIVLVRSIAASLATPVIAEGRYRSTAQISQAFAAGAAAVVVGTAITDPLRMTRRLVNELAREQQSAQAGTA